MCTITPWCWFGFLLENLEGVIAVIGMVVVCCVKRCVVWTRHNSNFDEIRCLFSKVFKVLTLSFSPISFVLTVLILSNTKTPSLQRSPHAALRRISQPHITRRLSTSLPQEKRHASTLRHLRIHPQPSRSHSQWRPKILRRWRRRHRCRPQKKKFRSCLRWISAG